MNIAYAQSQTVIISTAMGIKVVLCNIFNLIFWVLIGVSTIMVLVAAFTYITAGGDAEKVSKATKAITYAVIGLVVALLAKQAPVIIASFFGKGITTCAVSSSGVGGS